MVPQPPIDPRVRAALEGRTMILGVGAQKCASTWMFNHLALHTAVRPAPVKETSFFTAWLDPRRYGLRERRFAERLAKPGLRPIDRRRIAARVEMSEDRSAYLRWFASHLRRRTHLMEITPCYALLGEAELRFVRAHFETAGVAVRPLFILRDPVARIVSHHRSALKLRGPGYSVARGLLRSLVSGDQIARSRYDVTLERLYRVFGEAAVTVCFYERLFDAADPHLAETERALGLAASPALRDRRINASPEAPPPPEAILALLRRRLRPAYRFVEARFGAEIPAAWSGS